VHILLVDPTDETRALLHDSLSGGGANGNSITHLRPKIRKGDFETVAGTADVVLFGVLVTEKSVVRLTTAVRATGSLVPIFALTRKNENGISRLFKKAGVDDMVHIAELGTPIIAWTFMSSLKQAEVRKKATEFDLLRDQIKDINDTLACITHDINNPLSVIRLALYHLENLEITQERRETLFKIISESLDKLHSQTEQLRTVRRQLGNGAPLPNIRPAPAKNSRSKVRSQ